MTKADRFSAWVIFTTALYTLLGLGLLGGMDGCTTVAVVFVWMISAAAVIGCLASGDEDIKKQAERGFVTPHWLCTASDMPVVTILAMYDYPYAALAFFIHTICGGVYRMKVQEYIEKNKAA